MTWNYSAALVFQIHLQILLPSILRYKAKTPWKSSGWFVIIFETRTEHLCPELDDPPVCVLLYTNSHKMAEWASGCVAGYSCTVANSLVFVLILVRQVFLSCATPFKTTTESHYLPFFTMVHEISRERETLFFCTNNNHHERWTKYVLCTLNFP